VDTMFALKSLNLAFSSAVPVFNPNSSLNDCRARLVPMKADCAGESNIRLSGKLNSRRRDLVRSTHVVSDHHGRPTCEARIGVDLPVVDLLGGRAVLLDCKLDHLESSAVKSLY
jgi:hypothetical protein